MITNKKWKVSVSRKWTVNNYQQDTSSLRSWRREFLQNCCFQTELYGCVRTNYVQQAMNVATRRNYLYSPRLVVGFDNSSCVLVYLNILYHRTLLVFSSIFHEILFYMSCDIKYSWFMISMHNLSKYKYIADFFLYNSLYEHKSTLRNLLIDLTQHIWLDC